MRVVLKFELQVEKFAQCGICIEKTNVNVLLFHCIVERQIYNTGNIPPKKSQRDLCRSY